MQSFNSLYADIDKIHIAHEFTLNRKNKCEYPNGRKHYGIIYCIDGEAEYRFSSKGHLTVKKGDVLLISPEAAYSIAVKDEFKHYTVNFDTHNDFLFSDTLDNRFYLLHPQNTELYYHHFKNIVARRKSRSITAEMQATAHLYELLAQAISEIQEKEHGTGSHLRLQPAKEYIEHNFKNNISLNVLANLTDMSLSGFRREWLKQYGETAMQYRDKIRLRYAKEQLSSGYYTVTEVALKCGFEDVNYFIRFFKKNTGISPGKYKDML